MALMMNAAISADEGANIDELEAEAHETRRTEFRQRLERNSVLRQAYVKRLTK